MIMGDEIPVRVFDSVTAAVENSAQPPAPPYADVAAGTVADEQPDAPEEVQTVEPPKAPAKPKASARKTGGQNVRAQAGTAEGSGAAGGIGK